MVSKKIAPLVAGALLLASAAAPVQAAAGSGALGMAAAMQSSGEEAGPAGAASYLVPIFIVGAVALIAIAFQDNDNDQNLPASP